MPDDSAQAYDVIIRNAVKTFWGNPIREFTTELDRSDDKEIRRGKAMDGFCHLIQEVIRRNGLPDAEILTKGTATTLPGYFRPAKKWDVVIYNEGRLIGAVEFKSMRRSFGKNINNRAEEALGSAIDLRYVFKHGALKGKPKPFIGYIILAAITDESIRHRLAKKTRLGIDREFQDASYAKRYVTMCTRLVKSEVYSATALLCCDRRRGHDGHYESMGMETSLEKFIEVLGAHIAKEAQTKKRRGTKKRGTKRRD